MRVLSHFGGATGVVVGKALRPCGMRLLPMSVWVVPEEVVVSGGALAGDWGLLEEVVVGV